MRKSFSAFLYITGLYASHFKRGSKYRLKISCSVLVPSHRILAYPELVNNHQRNATMNVWAGSRDYMAGTRMPLI